MSMLPRLLFALLLVIAPAVILATSGGLPARVATHFGSGGLANGWMSHDGYLAFILVFAVVLPLIIVGMSGLASRIAGSRINIPNRDCSGCSRCGRASTMQADGELPGAG